MLLVYALAVSAGLVIAVGEVLEQRIAATAPPEHNLSPRLLLWLVRKPRWLAGVGCTVIGNALIAAAVGFGSVALVEAVFVVRLLFALVLAALWRRHGIPRRDILGALAITAGLVAFVLSAKPRKTGSVAHVPDLGWVIAGGTIVAVAVLIAAVARRLGPARKAVLLGTGAGALFALQASLVKTVVHLLRTDGVIGMLTTWNGYVFAVVALTGALLVQSAFEAAPLPASYPAVVTTELITGIALGVGLLGGTVAFGIAPLSVAAVSILVMVGGIYLLTTSPLVTGQLDELIRKQDVGLATHAEQQLDRELRSAQRAFGRAAGGSLGRRRSRRELARIHAGIERLDKLQADIREHRESELGKLDGLPQDERDELAAQSRELLDRERTIEGKAAELRKSAATLESSIDR
ncbi:MAG: DMT family transporter [Streptosporangiales bacterium]